jgi:hypothetical protein
MSGNRRFSGLFVLVVALLVAGIIVAVEEAVIHAHNGSSSGQPNASEGPLAPASDNFAGSSHSIDVGQQLSLGMLLTDYTGGQPAVLDSMTAVRPGDGVKILGFEVLSQSDNKHSLKSSAAEFPPAGYTLHPLPGYNFTAADGHLQIVIGLSVTKPGVFQIHGFTLAYHVGSKHYTATYRRTAALCSPVSTYPTCTALTTD